VEAEGGGEVGEVGAAGAAAAKAGPQAALALLQAHGAAGGGGGGGAEDGAVGGGASRDAGGVGPGLREFACPCVRRAQTVGIRTGLTCSLRSPDRLAMELPHASPREPGTAFGLLLVVEHSNQPPRRFHLCAAAGPSFRRNIVVHVPAGQVLRAAD